MAIWQAFGAKYLWAKNFAWSKNKVYSYVRFDFAILFLPQDASVWLHKGLGYGAEGFHAG
ncbi:MAG: hypothetical protein JXR97_11905 [Planctomycetes bacterium]|nr:hypothetical protein [Planctomycetota bacterium]